MNITDTFPASNHCVNEEFRFHLLRRGALNFLRGIAAAILTPLEMLECLRSGNCAGRGIVLSWALSAVMYTGVFEIWNLSNKAMFDGHDRTGSIFGYCLVVLVAGIWSGSLQIALQKHRGQRHEFHSGHHHGIAEEHGRSL